MAASSMNPSSLVGSWSHSHEEDAEGIQVFRPVDYDLPPSRGRETFTLRPDGIATAGSPGPDDRGITTGDGVWQLRGDVLHIRCPGWTARYEVISVTRRRLDLRPVHQA
ncbi:hypothetical protein [Streptosporangium sp. NBC_01756]|uniref:hypothetical protein n=1 Tax=Streptosporangium sp. NBC_01756 TaxID=2975950 RepID=UPI002DD9BA4C|nr:hypothetical protein [Streptosporangium sp. NBC_01756]WSC88981.1 hypothetical protein OIE48_12560 [Streptosporangium sp. NBC_01756]